MDKEMPRARAYTAQETTDHFLDEIWKLVDYCKNTPPVEGGVNRMEVLAFSICALIDNGVPLGLPGFEMVPWVHSEQREYRQSRGLNWYTDEVHLLDLHERFFDRRPPKG